MNAQSSNNNTLVVANESMYRPSLLNAIQSCIQSENGQVGQTQLQTALQDRYSQGYINLQATDARLKQLLGDKYTKKIKSLSIHNGSVIVELHGTRPKFKNPTQVNAGIERYANQAEGSGIKGVHVGVRAALNVETNAPLQQVCIRAVGTDARVRFGVDQSLINAAHQGKYLSILDPNDVASGTVNDEFGSAAYSKVQVMVGTITHSVINREQVVVSENNPRTDKFTEETELRYYNSQFYNEGDWAGATVSFLPTKRTNTVELNHHGLPKGDYVTQYEEDELIKLSDGTILHAVEHNNVSKELMNILHKVVPLKDLIVAVNDSSFGPARQTLNKMYNEVLEASVAASGSSELQTAYKKRAKTRPFTSHISGNLSNDEQVAFNSVVKFDPNTMYGHDENGDVTDPLEDNNTKAKSKASVKKTKAPVNKSSSKSTRSNPKKKAPANNTKAKSKALVKVDKSSSKSVRSIPNVRSIPKKKSSSEDSSTTTALVETSNSSRARRRSQHNISYTDNADENGIDRDYDSEPSPEKITKKRKAKYDEDGEYE